MKPGSAHSKSLIIPVALGVCAFGVLPASYSQGCIPARHLSLSLSAEGISYLHPGEWEADVSYRYLHAERVFIGTDEQPQLHDLGGRNSIHAFDLSATYAFSWRYSLSLTLPFEHDDFSLINDDLNRHSGSSSGPGDLRLVANAWIFNPTEHPDANINVGLGLKFPTGDYAAMDTYYTGPGKTALRPVDIAAQLGDGGWGVLMQLQGFQKLTDNFYGYVAGFYLVNPRDTNGTERPSPKSSLVNSVPDQYLGRAGVAYTIWPEKNLALSLGPRIDGIPGHDLIGESNGFRRAGYAVYVDPGISVGTGKAAFSLNVPVAVHRNLERTANSSAGSFADFLVVASFVLRF